MPSIIHAVRRSYMALERADRWYRATLNARTPAELEHARRYYRQAIVDHKRALRAARFPWEV